MTRRTFLQGALGGVIGATAVGAYADLAARNPVLEEVELRLPNWEANGLRVAFFSDIHVNDREEMRRGQRACEMIASAKPDLILFGGDAINTNATPAVHHISESLEPIRDLDCPKIAVLGNHDYWTGVAPKIERGLRDGGFEVLKNDLATIGRYSVAGYDDRIGGTRDPSFRPSRMGTLSLMHEPDFVDIVPTAVALQVSGHSHGGQICAPFGIPLHTPRGARKYWQGFYAKANVPLYVTRGVGTVGPKWRLFCPPEVTILTLRSAY